MGKSTTLIAKRTRVVGRIETDGDVVVEGRVEGTVIAGGRVTVAESGVAVAEIQATRVEVDGIVIGDVVSQEWIGVSTGARVVGDLHAPDVALASGATVDGRVDRRAVDRPRPRDEERREPVTDVRRRTMRPRTNPSDETDEVIREPVTEPRGRSTLRDGSAAIVRPGRPAARPAGVTGSPPRPPRLAPRVKLVVRRKSPRA